MTTIESVKLSLRISHSQLDEDLLGDIDACLADLRMHGVKYADESDPLILNAVKLYCKANYTDDVVKSAAYRERYNALRDCLKAAEGYGWRDGGDE